MLRAHCKRGDAARAKRTLQQMRALGVPLEPQGYGDLLGLAAQGGVGAPLASRPPDLPRTHYHATRNATESLHDRLPGALLALRPSDLLRSFGGEIEPALLRLGNTPNELDNDQIELLCADRPPPPSPPSFSTVPHLRPCPRPMPTPTPSFPPLFSLPFALTQTWTRDRYVGAALGFVVVLGAALLTSQPPPLDPLAF